MIIKAPKDTALIIQNSQDNIVIQLEDTNGLSEDIIKSVLEAKGHEPIAKVIDEDCIYELFEHFEDTLQDWLVFKGYIFNKA